MHFILKIIAAAAIVVLVTTTTTWSVSMSSQPSIASPPQALISASFVWD
jgi:hypothetical protein